MRYCIKCGRELEEGAAFCSNCGVPAKAEKPVPVSVPTCVVPAISHEDLKREEQEFLDMTHRLLRWERKAWNIAFKVFLILGIVYAVLFTLMGIIGIFVAAGGDAESGGMLIGFGFVYAIAFGSMFIAYGIVSKVAGQKLPQYLDSLYTDFSIAYKRCSSVGMLIFCIFCGVVSTVFFIINFVRMKSCRGVIERIMRNQNVRV